MNNKVDYLIIGAGIIGLTIARELNELYPNSSIVIIEKEKDVAFHSSGRNSGVLHAGFYYTSDSLKAKFTKEGNTKLKEYCKINKLHINYSKKIVVAKDKTELDTLYELEKRGIKNGVDVRIIDAKELKTLDANVKTYKKALYSPTTATINPKEVCYTLKDELIKNGIKFYFEEYYISKIDLDTIQTTNNTFRANKVINCAGLYADKIAKNFGFSKDYVIIPFKGIYLKYCRDDKPIKTNIYPVPNLNNPFLGVHYTITEDGTIKIGPTAIPAFWRENYNGFNNFKLNEFLEIIKYETKLFISDAFGFRRLAFEEIKKYSKKYLIGLATSMTKKIGKDNFDTWSTPGIRAQLVDVNSLELVQDFIVEGDEHSIHVLNAVSPAFTCSMSFAKWIVINYIEKENN